MTTEIDALGRPPGQGTEATPAGAVDVLIPSYRRPAALAVTLAGLLGQGHRPLRVVVSDQTEDDDVAGASEVRPVVSVLRHNGIQVDLHKHLPRRGLAEHRQFLLDQARAPYVLFLDDDVLVEPDLVSRLVRAIEREQCGFIGSFVNAASAVHSGKDVDRPPVDVDIELWNGPVEPEVVLPGTAEWGRSRLHFAAYLHRRGAERGLRKESERLYKVAWVGGCVLFDTGKLRLAGGFSFWPDLPADHCGEDVLAQLRVMARFGGAGLVPSGAWHQEVPTTTPDRRNDAPLLLGLDPRPPSRR